MTFILNCNAQFERKLRNVSAAVDINIGATSNPYHLTPDAAVWNWHGPTPGIVATPSLLSRGASTGKAK